jgi:branched-chain amino acid transport system permease protein
MRSWVFLIVALLVSAVVFAAALLAGNDYLLFAGYVVLQFVVLATAWNILGGYCGYVNFGSAAFFALGAYTTVALHKLGAGPDRYLRYLGQVAEDAEEHAWLARSGAWLLREGIVLLQPLLPLSLPALIVLGGIVAGIVGFGMGYLTLRLRGVFFAIATLAMAVVLHTIVVNWDYVGGSRGAYIIRPDTVSLGGVSLTYVQYLFLLMLLLAAFALWVARTIEHSRMGLGFATIRDDEAAAEASGVPTLRLKLAATAISGALMGMAGAPLPYYIGFVEPTAAFGLPYSVNAIAMPMIGGTMSWIGPLVGAILLGSLQQWATVTISSVWNLFIVGVLLVVFVIIAPRGIVGLVQDWRRPRQQATKRLKEATTAPAPAKGAS